MERILKKLLEVKGITCDSASVEYKLLLREVSRAYLASLRIDEARDQGDFSDPYYLPTKEEPKPQLRSTASAAPESVASSVMRLTDLIGVYSDEKEAKGKWTLKSKLEVTATLSVFVKILGNAEVKTLSRAQLVDCLTKVTSIKVKGKSISERTVKKYMNTLSSLLKYAAQNNYIDKNPAEGLAPAITKAPSEERSTYSPADLQTMVKALDKERGSRKPENYWIPLVALYSGLRLDEACQLYREDVKLIQGVWCLDVNSTGDKKVKSRSSLRTVPIHSELVALGFLEYHASCKHERLWPNLKQGRDGYSHVWGKTFQRFNRAKVTKDRAKVFHSLRHCFTDGLKQAGVQDQLIAELVGHTTGSITSERYGKPFNPLVLREAVERLRYDL